MLIGKFPAAASFAFLFPHILLYWDKIEANAYAAKEGPMSALTASRRRAVHFLVGALLFAFVVRLCIGMLYTNYFDIRWYLTWARSLPDGFFNCYVRLTDGQYALDYPPVYLVVLYLVGWLYRFIPLERYEMFEMLVMKFFPILFDILAAMCCICAAADAEKPLRCSPPASGRSTLQRSSMPPAGDRPMA